MKLLLDQNLSFRLADALAPQFPGTKHVRSLGLDTATDDALWRYAREQDYVIVSKDSDFFHRASLFGFPPKFIWLRVGNASTDRIKELLTRNTRVIMDFLPSDDTVLIIE